MTMNRLQSIVWALFPLVGLFLLIALMGARGGIWIVIPITLIVVLGGLLYLAILRARRAEH